MTLACAAVPRTGSTYCGPAAMSQTRTSDAAEPSRGRASAAVAAAVVIKVRRDSPTRRGGPLCSVGRPIFIEHNPLSGTYSLETAAAFRGLLQIQDLGCLGCSL